MKRSEKPDGTARKIDKSTTVGDGQGSPSTPERRGRTHSTAGMNFEGTTLAKKKYFKYGQKKNTS